MCRSIKTLFNFDPPVTDDEIRAASLQFVRKLSGFNTPSKANEAAFGAAIDEIASVSRRLLHSMATNAPPGTATRRRPRRVPAPSYGSPADTRARFREEPCSSEKPEPDGRSAAMPMTRDYAATEPTRAESMRWRERRWSNSAARGAVIAGWPSRRWPPRSPSIRMCVT
jgi:hypothetical protein